MVQAATAASNATLAYSATVALPALQAAQHKYPLFESEEMLKNLHLKIAPQNPSPLKIPLAQIACR